MYGDIKRPKKTVKQFDVNRTLPNYNSAPKATQGKKPYRSEPQLQPQDFRDQSEPDSEPKKSIKKVFIKIFIFLLILVLVLPSIFIFWNLKNASYASKKMFGTSSAISALLPQDLKSNDGRTNILLIGYSADDAGHAGANLTDSIMLVSMDKHKKAGYMLSIPRDLYVKIPNYGYGKINEAYQAGETQNFSEAGYANGGVGLLEKVVGDIFDVKINYYTLINYGAVRDLTNSLGGITVNIESPDPRGIYDPNFKPNEGGPLQLTNGTHKIDGQTALRLTRARGSTYGSYGFPQSDFNRVLNQQKVFTAIRSQMTMSLLLNPTRNKPFFDAAADNLQTNLNIHEVLPIILLFKSIPDNQMKSVDLTKANGQSLLESYRTRTGQSALVPVAGMEDYSGFQKYVKSLNSGTLPL